MVGRACAVEDPPVSTYLPVTRQPRDKSYRLMLTLSLNFISARTSQSSPARTMTGRTRRKRSLMWRSIILSTFAGETYLPYFRHIRYLDLCELDELVRHDEFKTSLREWVPKDEVFRYRYWKVNCREFFSGKLETMLFSSYDDSMEVPLSQWVCERAGSGELKIKCNNRLLWLTDSKQLSRRVQHQ